MPSATRYARAPDGTRIAWSSAGSGSPPLLLTDGIGCAGFVWRLLAPAIARRRRVLHWNYRGHGRSDAPRDPSQVTIARCVDDLLAVLDAAGEERAIVAGHSMGVQVALEAHRRAPDRVAGLVLLFGAPGRLLEAFHDSSMLATVFPWIRGLFERWPRAGAAGFRAAATSELAMHVALSFEVNRDRVRHADMRRYFRDLSRVDGPLFVRLLDSAAAHDASDHLREIRVPTLIFAGERDAFTPMRLSLRMHEAIAGSELVVLPEGTHTGPLEYPDVVEERVRRFLERFPVRRRRARAPGRAGARAARHPAPRRRVARRAR